MQALSRLGATCLVSVALVIGTVSAPASAAPASAAPVTAASATSSGVASSNVPRPGLTSYTKLDYVALGDSFTSGQGAPPYSDLTCLRSQYKSYPIITSVLSPYRLTANKACSGANVDAVTAQLAGLSLATKQSTKLVTLTVGGIDAGSNAVLAACADSPTTPDLDCAIELGKTTSRLTALAAQLPGLYAGMATALPNARIAVLGYPLLFKPGVSSLGQLVNEGTLALNGVIQGSASAVVAAGIGSVRYVDVTQEFAGHGIGSAVPYIAFNPNDLAAPANFHPNVLGNTGGYYRALVNDGLLRR